MTSPLPPTSDDKLLAGLSYAGVAMLGLPGLIIYLMKKGESDYIKFHSLQSIGFFLLCILISILMMVASTVLAVIPVLGWMLAGLLYTVISLGLLVYWIYLMVQAFMGKDPRIPLLAEQIQNNFMGA